ncbi:M61 family peptidase [Shivajiella indica]|uniref:M61 family peptidase n=1 Tax=Shivajiella indica TaxID=872115 RepID=A0ABW5B5N1_9BACT
MHYQITRKSISSQYIEIKLFLDCKTNEEIHLQLAAWRPGRYELANYAQKIRGFKVENQNQIIAWKKLNKDFWSFKAMESGEYLISYEYYCNQMDAGSCWSDDTQLYLNFSNFIFDIPERKGHAIRLSIEVPSDYKIATAMTLTGLNQWLADSYQHLMDSPFLASGQLNHFTYQVDTCHFHLWFNGKIHFDVEKLVQDFRKFTAKQIQAFGEFPAKDYHFIFQLLPYKHYHGVEHAFSTVITIGPAEKLKEKGELDELFGISSHELYHFWNVCRLRPIELLEYDLSKEAYLDTGVVLEGVTTYMGDLFLLRSGYFSLKDYLLILEKKIQRELDSFGWKNQSIVESSFDLWLDGYKQGIPDKKVNIYNRGALLALCLDLILLENGSSLSQVMKSMWEKFGKTRKGYKLEDFKESIAEFILQKGEVDIFFNRFVFGHDDLSPLIFRLLDSIGIRVEESYSSNILLHQWGIRTDEKGKIKQIHPESLSYNYLMLEDQILNFDEINNNIPLRQLEIEVSRWNRELSFSIPMENRKFFPLYKLNFFQETPKLKKWME